MAEPSTPKLNIVCALKTIRKEIGAAKKLHLDSVESEYEIENQHGIWNKGTLKWWVKGDVRDELFDNREQFMIRCFNIAFTEIDIEIPLVLLHAEDEEDADIIIEFGPRAGDPYYADNNAVLGYAGYPIGRLKGFMKIFTDWDWNTRGGYNIITLIIHELGHILGRPHSARRLWIDMMDPIINANITELSDHDIAGFVSGYGARVYSSPTGHDRLEQANKRQKERLRFG